MSIGVLLFATAGDRLKGDPGYPGTFEFPVEYGIVEGSYRDLIEGSPDACRRLCEAAKSWQKECVRNCRGLWINGPLPAADSRFSRDSCDIFQPFISSLCQNDDTTGTVGLEF